MAVSFQANLNQYDIEDLEQMVMMETLEVMRSFVPYPDCGKDGNNDHKSLDNGTEK